MKYAIAVRIGGPNCITADDGQKIYDLIHPPLSEGQDVELDFTGVRIVASPFLNAAIGQLLKDIKPDILNTHLRFTELPMTTRPILARVIENAKNYYGNEVVQKAVEDALQEELGEGNAR